MKFLISLVIGFVFVIILRSLGSKNKKPFRGNNPAQLAIDIVLTIVATIVVYIVIK